MAHRRPGGAALGVILIGLGVLFLANQFFDFNIWRYIWPLFVIAFGLTFFIGMVSRGRSAGGLAIPGSIFTMIGLILFFQNTFGMWATWAYAWTLIVVAVGVGLVIHGLWSNQDNVRRSGIVVGLIGFMLFMVFGSAFELSGVLGMAGGSKLIWPLLLIGLGLFLIYGRTRGGRGVMDKVISSEAESQVENIQAVREVSGFNRVSFHALGDLFIRQGEQEELRIEANQTILARITTEVRDQTLLIRYRSDWQDWLGMRWVASGPVRFYLTVKELVILSAGSLGNISASELKTATLELNQSGAGNIQVAQLAAESLAVRMSGLGNVDVTGTTGTQEVHMSGAGNFNGGNLESQKGVVHLSGLGNATVWAKESLDVHMSGAGNVEYYGQPALTRHTSGVGNLRSLGNRERFFSSRCRKGTLAVSRRNSFFVKRLIGK